MTLVEARGMILEEKILVVNIILCIVHFMSWTPVKNITPLPFERIGPKFIARLPDLTAVLQNKTSVQSLVKFNITV